MRRMLKYMGILFVGYIVIFVTAACLSYLYYHCTQPSWDKLSGIIASHKIIITKSKHDKADGYHAEFRIRIPHTEDIKEFICTIERIGSKALIRKKMHPSGKIEYYFPIGEIWVHVIGKDGHYFVEYTHMFDSH